MQVGIRTSPAKVVSGRVISNRSSFAERLLNPLNGLFSQHPTYTDVKAFLETRIRETTRHDYKRELPREPDKIAKTLVSFANTFGGVIVVGVDQDKDGGPILPAIGVKEAEPELARVQQLANERVNPAVPIDLERVRIPEGEPNAGNYILLVRVPESPQAPHAVIATGAIFVRRGDHASKEAEAFPPLKQLELLFQRRQGPEALRDELWRRADGRSPRSDLDGPRFAFGVGPMFPRVSLAPESRVLELLLSAFEGAPARTIVGGAHVDDDEAVRKSASYYAELFTHGFHFEAGKFRVVGVGEERLDLGWLIEVLGGCWIRARSSMAALNVHGLLRLRVELRNVGGWRVAGLGDKTCLEQSVCHDDAVNSWAFIGDDSILYRAIHRLRWGLGHAIGSAGEVDSVRRALRVR